MSDLPSLERLIELRPDLTFPMRMNATAVYIVALKAFHDAGEAPTEETFMRWVEDHYPDRRRQSKGRPRLNSVEVHRRYATAVRELRRDGRPPTNDAQVAEHLGMESDRQITTWRRRFNIPHVRDVPDE